MEKALSIDGVKYAVLPHKNQVNPVSKSLLIPDNHGSRFTIEAI